MSKKEFLEYELKHIQEIPMTINALLVPEVCKYKSITLDDLKEFEFAFKKMDERHKYLEVIYQSYIENGSFILTQEQRDEAYRIYK